VPALRAAILALAGAVFLAGCQPTGAPVGITPGDLGFGQLAGWSEDNVAAAVPAFLKSCRTFLAQGDAAPLDPKVKSGDFGTVGEWRSVCDAATRLSGTNAAARQFFETAFVPVPVTNRGDPSGLFTGYFEISLNGSRQRMGPFQTPIYRRPPDPRAYSHAEIGDGALAHKGLELVWVDDPVGAFFMQIQGSGLIRLQDGSAMRLGYDGGNGRPYIAIGRLLVERGEVPLSEMTMDRLRQWIVSHSAVGTTLMRENPSYVFFKEIDEGPLGSEGVVLTAERSLAVDRAFVPLGVPIWLDAEERFTPGVIRRLAVAQDTGGAIKGAVRGDLFWGSDETAASRAGAMNATGRYYMLLPLAAASRALAAASGS
jgi:membrane-bound lytic murein transglycosylase A